MSCPIHPAAATGAVIDGTAYCQSCAAGIRAAQAQLDGHITPRSCFVVYAGAAAGWTPIPGTGCAHYVAHQLNIRNGARCLAGFSIRVPQMIAGKTLVAGGLSAVRVGDIWVNRNRTHTGLVSRVVAPPPPPPPAPATGTGAPAAAPPPPPPPQIYITHASSAHHALSTDRFDTYFHSSGDFFR
jgi:hypothetical protein